MTRWLNPDEQRTWRAFLFASRALLETLDKELQRDSGMPHAYYEILVRLSEAPDRSMRMSDLADSLASSRSRISHAVTRLTEQGWVRREDCPTDRRGQLAVLTEQGYEVLAAAAPRHVDGVRAHLFDQLTPEQLAQLGQIGTRLLDHLDPDHELR